MIRIASKLSQQCLHVLRSHIGWEECSKKTSSHTRAWKSCSYSVGRTTHMNETFSTVLTILQWMWAKILLQATESGMDIHLSSISSKVVILHTSCVQGFHIYYWWSDWVLIFLWDWNDIITFCKPCCRMLALEGSQLKKWLFHYVVADWIHLFKL